MTAFLLHADPSARKWMDEHPSSAPRVIAYDVHRCCGGGKICQVTIRGLSARDDSNRFTPAALDDGTAVLIDRRAAVRLPSRFGLTVRGVGPLKHLDLDLDAGQWGTLLYD
jgi:hypothetical protein